ncbi:stAR-related lipid transfer protein 7, mitochondrial-like [Centruroides sculpturatus]|uniref:stAR-related lipid transfer protein 7, mitochondrial-like n=1 Tax=Centruroides sculpturatus TaxID=218467 RepID=UPI000C6C90D2|nr:stAR-related lipid transfer protein 7, mitochondrial-like [Centruroides sculpturatus]
MSGSHAFMSFACRLRSNKYLTGDRCGWRPWIQRWNHEKSTVFRKELWCQINNKLIILGEILTKQCNFYASQRLRRTSQIWYLYTKLYNEKSFHRFVTKIVKQLRFDKKKPVGMLLGACLFSWDKVKITHEEINRYVEEFDKIGNDVSKSLKYCHNKSNKIAFDEGWEPVISKENLFLWRKSMPGTYLYEYKVYGSFFDIPPRVFFHVQKDTEYRKKWDKLVIKLDIIDREGEDGNEVVHWVMHYPKDTEYRKKWDKLVIKLDIIDREGEDGNEVVHWVMHYPNMKFLQIDYSNNVMVLVSRAADHPSCPPNNKYVRVTNYSSRMVIKPHRGFDENGFDYILTYFDDPQAAFPSPAYNWMASSGVPDFVEKLHAAAQELYRHSWSHSVVSSSNTCPSNGIQYAYA